MHGAPIRAAAGDRRIPVINPCNGKLVTHIAEADTATVDDAVQSAREAQAIWADLSGAERARVLLRAADILHERIDDLAGLETLDTGRAVSETVLDPADARDCFRWSGRELER